jgi:hypothetical protein
LLQGSLSDTPTLLQPWKVDIWPQTSSILTGHSEQTFLGSAVAIRINLIDLEEGEAGLARAMMGLVNFWIKLLEDERMEMRESIFAIVFPYQLNRIFTTPSSKQPGSNKIVRPYLSLRLRIAHLHSLCAPISIRLHIEDEPLPADMHLFNDFHFKGFGSRRNLGSEIEDSWLKLEEDREGGLDEGVMDLWDLALDQDGDVTFGPESGLDSSSKYRAKKLKRDPDD